jgi:chemotaxis protein CheX
MSLKYVLVVDDEPDLIDIYTEILSTLGPLKIITAVDGMDAYRKARNQKFELIITDYKMPKLNGVQLILALRDNIINASTPIIVVSGYPDKALEEIKQERLEKNVTMFSKPVDFKMLINLATNYLQETPTPKSVDVEFLNPFLAAVKIILKDMAQVESITSGKLEVSTSKLTLDTEISSYLSVSSAQFSGMFILTFPITTYLNIVARALGGVYSEINDENRDFAGELSNIIFGTTKRLWKESGYTFEKAIPHVQSGVNFTIPAGNAIPSLVVPFDSEIGRFYAVISILRK